MSLPSPSMLHMSLPAEEAHVPGYCQSSDPGAIGAQKLWIDTALGVGKWVVKLRNDANDGWDTVFNPSAITAYGTLVVIGANGGSDIANIEVGMGRSASGYAFLDLVGDTTYNDYGLRVMRGNGGANAVSQITHRGTGDLSLITSEAANIVLQTAGATAVTISGSDQSMTVKRLIASGASSTGFALLINGDMTPAADLLIANISNKITPSININNIYGLLFTPKLAGNKNVVGANGIYARIDTDATFSGILTAATIIRIADSIKAAGTITTQYGLFIDPLTQGATNYAIYTQAGIVRLGGDLVHAGAAVGFYNKAAVAQPTDGVALTNSVTAGGTTDTISNWTNLSTYSTDAAAIRNAIYQLARKLKITHDALRSVGLIS